MILAILLLVQDPAILLRGGVVHVGDGRLRPTGAVLFRAGKIEEGEPPAGAVVVELPSGFHVTPGYIDLHSHLGMAAELDEPARPLTPHMRASDGFATDRDDVRAARASGVTRVALAPGDGNVVGGAMSLIRLRGGLLHDVLEDPVAGMKLALGPPAIRRDREPTSLAGALALLESELADVASETHRRLIQEKRPVFVRASGAEEIDRALKLKAAHGLRLSLLDAEASDETAAAIAAAGVPVVIGPLTPADADRALRRPALLAAAGVTLGFCSDAPRTSEEQLRLTALLAVQHGLAPESAVKALTRDAARLLGIEARAGTLEAGKDADLVVTSGHPLAPASRVVRVIVGGVTVFERPAK